MLELDLNSLFLPSFKQKAHFNLWTVHRKRCTNKMHLTRLWQALFLHRVCEAAFVQQLIPPPPSLPYDDFTVYIRQRLRNTYMAWGTSLIFLSASVARQKLSTISYAEFTNWKKMLGSDSQLPLKWWCVLCIPGGRVQRNQLKDGNLNLTAT